MAYLWVDKIINEKVTFNRPTFLIFHSSFYIFTDLSLTIALLLPYYSLTITIRFPWRSYTGAIPELYRSDRSGIHKPYMKYEKHAPQTAGPGLAELRLSGHRAHNKTAEPKTSRSRLRGDFASPGFALKRRGAGMEFAAIYETVVMSVISSKVHGVLDYTVGVILIVAPWLLGFARGGAETWVPVILGCLTLLYSICTNYEFARFRVIPFKAHLLIDFLSGVVLAASPWLFKFNDYVYLPHLILGLFEIVVVLLSDKVAFGSRTMEARNTAARPAHSQ
jgi:SPW repeat